MFTYTNYTSIIQIQAIIYKLTLLIYVLCCFSEIVFVYL